MSESTTGPQKFLQFSLGEEEYAVSLSRVKEVIAFPEVTPVPYTPSHFLGIMNLRGQVISVVDLRLKFKMSKAERNQETAVIILDLSPMTLGVVVNSVNSVLAALESEIAPRPDIETSQNSEFIIGVVRRDKALVLLLDIARALNVQDLQAMGKATPHRAA